MSVPTSTDSDTDPDYAPGDEEAVEDFNREPDADVGEAAGRSIEDLASGDEPLGEEEDGQLFVLEEAKPVTLGTLIKRGTPVEYEFALNSKSIPGAPGMSLMSFSDPDRTLIVPGRAGKVVIDPTYNPDGSIKRVKVRATFKPTMAYDARSEAGRIALQGE